MSSISSADQAASVADHVPLYLMLGFNSIAAIVLAFRYFSTRVPSYLFLAAACLVIVVGDGLRLGFHLRIGYGTAFSAFMRGKGDKGEFSKVLGLFISALALLIVGQVIFDIVTVLLLRQWIVSVEGTPRVAADKKATASKIAGALLIVYPITATVYIIACSVIVFAPTSRGVMGILALVVGLIDFVAGVTQTIVCIWLWLSIRGAQQDEAHLRKRNQIIRLVFLGLFSESALYYRMGSVFSLWWIIRLIIVMWPGALDGYDEAITAPSMPQKGMDEKAAV